MTAYEIYEAQYEEERTWYDDEWTKYEWAARKIFNLTTYDAGLDEAFVKTIVEVCKVILERRNFEYIRNKDNYVIYIIVCQLLNRFGWINWGTSIRGAWFESTNSQNWDTDTTTHSKDILEELYWCNADDQHRIDSVPFTEDNLRALIEFMGGVIYEA